MIFTDHAQNALSLGEATLIKLFTQWLDTVNPVYPRGMGDDCAVIEKSPERLLLTTDTITYRKHFDDSVSAYDAGAKLIKRNVSDIAAMGGIPKQALLTLLCGPNTSIEWLKAFFDGIRETCLKYQIQLVGGDISSLDPNQFSAALTLTGDAPQGPKLRRTAGVHDHILVTGQLGGSRLGKHFKFDPRLPEGQWLASQDAVTAMMDLTDGLGKDLQELLPAKAAAALSLETIPIDSAAQTMSAQSGQPAIAHAFQDGEDYELLFTVEASGLDALLKNWEVAFPKTRISRIGQIVSGPNSALYLDATTGEALPWTRGYEHLSST